MKFTWVHVLCLVVVRASAQSFDSGFRLNNFNNLNRRCDDGFGVQTPVIETSRFHMPNFVVSATARQTCDCRFRIKKEIITIPSVHRFFEIPSNTIIQAILFFGARNIQIPAFSFPSLKVFTEIIPAPMVGTINRIFSGTTANIRSSIARPVYGLGGNFQRLSNGVFLGNALGAAAKIERSLPGTVGTGFNSRGSGTVPPRSSVANSSANEELRNRC